MVVDGVWTLPARPGQPAPELRAERGVVERSGPGPDAAASLEHLPELAEGRPMDVRQVAAFGKENIDLDPAQRRRAQRRDQRAVRKEVGRADADRMPCRAQRSEDRPAQALQGVVGTGGASNGQ